MKRIICVLIALFTFIGSHADAQININIGSNNGEVGDVVFVPVYVQIPLGNNVVDHCEGSFTSIDPTVAQIINISSNIGAGTTTMDGLSANFSFDNKDVGLFGGVFVTLEVKIFDIGCSYIALTSNTAPAGTLEFELDGVVFDDLITDFNISPGQVCGIQNCTCNMDNVPMGPFLFTPAAGTCDIYTISLDPVSPCNNTEFSHSYYWEVFLNSTGALTHTHTGSNFTQNAFAVAGMYTVVVHFTLTDNAGCTRTVSYSEQFDFSGCGGCSCNPNNLALGAVTFIQSTSDCSSYVLNIPPVLGCLAVEASRQYNFKVYNPSGTLIHNVNETLDGTLFDFFTYPPGLYTVVVTYTMTDDSGCVHELPPSTGVLNWTGCAPCINLAAPTNLNCNLVFGQTGIYPNLSWDPVPDASSYEIEIIYNDPSCCSGLMSSPTVVRYARTTEFFALPAGVDCFSWRVRSKCINGTISAWSSKECTCDATPGPSRKSAVQTDIEGALKLTAVPNPANNQVNITLTGWSNEIMVNQPEIVIYDISGKMVYTSEIALEETKSIDLSSFNSGAYIINIVDNGVLLSTEKLIVE